MEFSGFTIPLFFSILFTLIFLNGWRMERANDNRRDAIVMLVLSGLSSGFTVWLGIPMFK